MSKVKPKSYIARHPLKAKKLLVPDYLVSSLKPLSEKKRHRLQPENSLKVYSLLPTCHMARRLSDRGSAECNKSTRAQTVYIYILYIVY